MATRRAFNHTEDPIDTAPEGEVLRGTCFANGCVMPGTISAGNGSWQCAWHYGAQPSAIPRVTQVLRDWECLTYESSVGRRALTGKHFADPKVLMDLHAEAIARVLAATKGGGWGDYFERHGSEDYRRWINRIEIFLGKRIGQALGARA